MSGRAAGVAGRDEDDAFGGEMRAEALDEPIAHVGRGTQVGLRG